MLENKVSVIGNNDKDALRVKELLLETAATLFCTDRAVPSVSVARHWRRCPYSTANAVSCPSAVAALFRSMRRWPDEAFFIVTLILFCLTSNFITFFG